MPIAPKIQATAFDVATWEPDAEWAVFPQGARAKEAVFAPLPPPEPVLIPGRRYLFKRSKKSFPDQFWGEVIAYRIGSLMGLPVPPAFAAWNSRTGICAALSEWFYEDRVEAFFWAGDFLEKLVRPGFDRQRGKQHNIKDNVVLMRMFAQSGRFRENWRQWWVDTLLFDALIGNTDRHQDNWGFVFDLRSQAVTLSPLFDNGTALGHEYPPARVASWLDADMDRYIARGVHHLRWSLEDPKLRGHQALLRRALDEWPDTREAARHRMAFSQEDLFAAVGGLADLDLPIRLSPERLAFMLRLLNRRHELLSSLLV